MSCQGYTRSICSFVVGFLVFLSMLGNAQASHPGSQGLSKIPEELSWEAVNAIKKYFVSSNREIKSIALGTASRIVNQEYLVEAEVIAHAGFTQEYIPYHCGVFIEQIREKARRRWLVKFTTCEAYTLTTR